MITPEQARQELARRELVRRQEVGRPPKSGPQPTAGQLLNKLARLNGQEILDPFSTGTRINRTGGIDPFGLVEKAAPLTMAAPTGSLEPALSGAGALAGGPVGAGLGGALGNALERAKQDTGKPTNPFRAGKTAAGVAGAGIRDFAIAKAGDVALKKTADVAGRYVGQPIKRLFSSKAGKQAAGEIQSSALAYKKSAGEGIEAAIEEISKANPSARLSGTKQAVEALRAEIEANPQVLKAIEAGQRKAGSRLLTDLLDGAAIDPTDLTLQQGQELKAIIDRSPGIQAKLLKGGFGDYTPADIPLLDFKDEIRAAQINLDPKVSEAFGNYHEAMSNYRTLRPKIRPGSFGAGGTPRLGQDPFVKEAYKTVVPKPIRAATRNTENVKTVGRAAGVVTAEEVLRKLFFRGR